MQQTPLAELLSQLESELIRLQYTNATLRYYRTRWKQLKEFAAERGVTEYTEDLGAAFLQVRFGISIEDFGTGLTQSQTQELRIIRMIGDFQQHHAILRRYYKHRQLLTNPFFVEIRERFQSHCRGKGYSAVTIEHYLKKSTYFMDFLAARGMENFDALTVADVHAYLRTLAGFAFKTIELYVCSLRAFFRFLLAEGIVEKDFAAAMPAMKARKQTNIPSVWTQDELKQLIGAIDRGSPKGKRDYALILIACRLGLRTIDIKHLQFENFDWTSKTLSIIQSKTKEPLVLPIPSDVGWAVIDYLQHGRPPVDSPFVFIRHTAPFLPFSDADHLSQIIYSYMRAAHISKNGKRRGMHSLRHTMASVLLKNDTPLPVISDILGHIDTNSTATYLKVDLHQLAKCPFDFEEVIHIG